MIPNPIPNPEVKESLESILKCGSSLPAKAIKLVQFDISDNGIVRSGSFERL